MEFKKLIQKSGDEIYVNPCCISVIFPRPNDECVIYEAGLEDSSFTIQGSAEEIARILSS